MERFSHINQLEEKLIEATSTNQEPRQIDINEESGCCSCCSNKKSKDEAVLKYINSWRTYLENVSLEHTNEPFKILTNLWAHKNVIKDLENIRLNPNLVGKIRDDLEFYIPQLCTFLTFGVNETVEEFVAFLCKASCACFYFAHRVIWFFMSLDENYINESQNNKINGILNLIFNMFRSVKNRDKIINLFLANSAKYLNIIENNNLLYFYQHKIIRSILTPSQLEYLNRSLEITTKIREFDLIYDSIRKNEKEKISKFDEEDIKKNIINELVDEETGNILFIPTNDKEIELFYKCNKLDLDNIFIKIFPKPGEQIKIVDDLDGNDQDELEANNTKSVDELYLRDEKNSSNIEKGSIFHSLKNLDDRNELINNENYATNSCEEKLIPEESKQNDDELNNNRDKEKMFSSKIQNQTKVKFSNTNSTNTMLNNQKQQPMLINSLCRKDVNLNAFNSTLNFFENLCIIGEQINSIPDLLQAQNFLKKELFEINKKLPANVYLPFIKIRSNTVAHISLTESRIFKTKNRAPYMIVVEVFRPEELSLNYYDQKQLDELKNSQMTKHDSTKNVEEVSKNKDFHQSYGFAKKNSKKSNKSKRKSNSFASRSKSRENSFLNEKINLNETVNYVKVDLKNKISNEEAVKILAEENDIYNSKPIKVKLYGSVNKNVVNEDKIIVEEEAEYAMSKQVSTLVASKKDKLSRENIDSYVQKRLTNCGVINLRRGSQKDSNIVNFATKNHIHKIEEEPVDEKSYFNKSHDLSTSKNIQVKVDEIIDEQIKLNKDDFKLTHTSSDNSINFKITEIDDKVTGIDSIPEANANLETPSIRRNKKMKLLEEKDIAKHSDRQIETSPKANTKNIKTKKPALKLKKMNPKERIAITNKLNGLFGESLEESHLRLKNASPYGKLESFRIFKFIVKTGEDLRQEQFATQLINEFNQIFYLEKLDLVLNTYEVIATGSQVGVVEFINDSISLDEMKRKANMSLKDFFDIYFSDEKLFTKISLKEAKFNFIRSFAAYCLVCYFLQIKDRHNANIMLDRKGYISHIDFGFMLTNAPGNIQFEKAPFKLSNDVLELMDGVNSSLFDYFRKLLWKGFRACVKHSSKIVILVEMMYCGHGASLSCFQRGEAAITELKDRFSPKENMKTVDYLEFVDKLIEKSIDNWRTNWYDKFQYYVQGIFY